jgi:lysyl-tRNA synthetase class 2
MLQTIRQFFAEKNVLEVETPILCHTAGTDPNLDFFTTELNWSPENPRLYLQTSPEFAMKRLLAGGSGSIYQICKAFRNGESGRFHNPEFTLLEWYRVGYDLQQLMDEVDELIGVLFAGVRTLKPTQQVSYHSLFQFHTGLNPLIFSYQEYLNYAEGCGLEYAASVCGQDHAVWLDFIFSHQIQPQLEFNRLLMVYEYPACLSSLARINEHNALATDRVEVFLDGVELGNGYYELRDACEQEQRFDKEISIRMANNRPKVAKDQRLLAALTAGLPDCSGIAIGLDRLLMLLSESSTIEDVLPFSISRA